MPLIGDFRGPIWIDFEAKIHPIQTRYFYWISLVRFNLFDKSKRIKVDLDLIDLIG